MEKTTAFIDSRARVTRPPEPRRRWRIAWLLGLGVLVNYFDRVNLSVSHDALVSAFGISDITFGYLLAAYNWSYALCQLPMGVILDRFGVRRVGRISTCIWSLASFAAAGAQGTGSFLAARLLLGVGEAPTFPANAKAIGVWFPPEERSLATSTFDSAAKLASAVGVPLIGILLLRIGWRMSFAATGVISFAYFVLFWRLYKAPQEDAGLSVAEFEMIGRKTLEEGEQRTSASLGYLLRQRKVVGLALGFGSYNYVFYLLLTWLPTYLSRSLHIDLLHSFIYTGLPWLVAVVTEVLVGGWLVDTLVQRGWNASRVRMIALVAGTTLGLGIVGAGWSHSAGRALFWISLSNGALAVASAVAWSVPSLIGPPGSVGKIGGIVNFSNQLSGIAAPIVTGYLVFERHSFTAAFTIAAVYLAIGICAYVFLLHDMNPIPLQTPA